jgi:hypothetical protein
MYTSLPASRILAQYHMGLLSRTEAETRLSMIGLSRPQVDTITKRMPDSSLGGNFELTIKKLKNKGIKLVTKHKIRGK